MARITSIVALVAVSALSADAFTVSNMPRTTLSTMRMAEDEDTSIPTAERGVSLDQDGKSNVWAIEPKIEVESKSSEEKTSSAIFAAGGFAAFAVAAGAILTNLPDPNQF
eukprot:CAMPEP_0197236542 /NCGR_PEP_ID=MMETSP1429-20130617/3610_1 /TAXON_ID=49237 /ORGANISM="Chaetoceros  sp., Strain UNC1202" /LENGTH=109 /DNA_ID=CAMNT_0042695337 /DNA_START=33 /DNA_END=362 /DNA_ORIENTATION=+